jgi:hypothetical protein
MERTYWLVWEKFLQKNGLKPFVSGLLLDASSLVMVLAQVMVLGLPLVRSTSWRGGYEAMIHTLSDSEHLDAFADFLMEANV